MRSIGSRSWIERLTGLSPQPAPPLAFAIDGHELRGAAFRREREGLILREMHSVPLAAGTFAGGTLGGPIADADSLTRTVADLVSRFRSPTRRASLVLPDLWARGLVVELGALPARPALRDEILRFRLRKLIPFRIDELRIAASPIPSVLGQEDPVRALCLYAADGVCGGLESAFATSGVAIGQISNATLALLGAVNRSIAADRLTGVATVGEGGFALVFARRGEPLVWRQKSFGDGLDENQRAPLLIAELRLTRTYLEQKLHGETLDRVLLAAPAGVEAFWTSVLGEGLSAPVLALDESVLPLAALEDIHDLRTLSPMLGAACLEVA